MPFGRQGKCGNCGSLLSAPGEPIEVPNAEAFDALIKGSSEPVVVDFWAPWCGPCRTLAPTVAEIAAEYKDRAVVGKVNVDDEAALAEKYRIEGIPAILIFKDGKMVQNMVGVRPKADYQAVLSTLVGPPTAAPSPSAAK